MKNMLENCRGGIHSAGNSLKALALGFVAVVLGGASAMAEGASPYVSNLTTAANQITTDLGAAMPIALGVAIVSVGIFIVWRVFKRLAAG